MSKYAVYEIFGDSAPYNVEFCGHLAGALVGTSDKNPLSRPNEDATGGKAIRELGYETVEDGDGDA